MESRPQTAAPLEDLLAETEWLGRLATQLVPAADREDLVQDVLVAAMRTRGRPGSLRGWLATVARNLAAKKQVRERNRRDREAEVGKPESGEPAVDDALARFATHRAVVNAVMELEEPYRTAVLLRFWEDLPPREVARRTHVPVETARTRIKRGVQQLRARLDREHGTRGAWVLPLLQIGAVERACLAAAATSTASVPILTGAVALKKLALAIAVIALVAFTIPMLPLESDDSPQLPDEALAQSAAPGDNRGSASSPARARRSEVSVAQTPGVLVATVLDSADAPIKGAGVYVRDVRGRGLGFELHTSADGTATFEDLRPGEYRVLLARGGWQRVHVPSGGEARCVLTLSPGIKVSGRVVDPSARPVGGALVLAEREQHADLFQPLTKTENDGRFVVHDLAPGTKLHARASGWQPTSYRRGQVTVSGKPGTSVEVVLELGARGSRLDGQVLDPAGKPAVYARIGIAVDEDARRAVDGLSEIRRDDGNKQLDRETFLVRADANGRFTTDEVPWGDVVVLARGGPGAESYVAGQVLRIGKRSQHQTVIRLTRGASVSGVVRDEDGEPYPGVVLTAAYEGSDVFGELDHGLGSRVTDVNTTTDEQGRYRIDGLLAADYWLRRILPEDDQRLERFQIGPGEHRTVDVTLPRTWQMTVRVRDEDGRPCAGWCVFLSASGQIYYPKVRGTLTDREGVRVATGLRTDRCYVTVHAPDPGGERPFRRFPSFLARVTRGQAALDVEVVRPSGSITARLVGGAARSRVTRGSVKLLHAVSKESDRYRVGTDGRFRIDNMPAGSFALEIRGDGFPTISKSVELGRGENMDLGEIVLPDPALLEVEVTADDGKPIDHPRVWLMQRHVEKPDWRYIGGLYRKKTEALHRSQMLLPGSYRVFARGDDAAVRFEDVQLTAGTRRLELRCPRGVEQAFAVTMPDTVAVRHDLGHAWLVILDQSGERLFEHYTTTQTLPDGRPVVHASLQLTPGVYQISVRGRKEFLPQTVRVPSDEPIEVSLTYRR